MLMLSQLKPLNSGWTLSLKFYIEIYFSLPIMTYLPIFFIKSQSQVYCHAYARFPLLRKMKMALKERMAENVHFRERMDVEVEVKIKLVD